MDSQEPGPIAHATNLAVTAGESEPSRAEANYPDDQPTSDTLEPPKPPKDAAAGDQDAAPASDPDYQLTMPDGVTIDPQLLASAVPMLKDAGISSDQASKMVPIVTHIQERLQQAQLDEFAAMRADWAKEVKADAELGGKNLKETTRLAGIALKAGGAEAGDHEARQLLNESGLGNHPILVRLFRNLGAALERASKGKETPAVKESTIEVARRRHQESVYPNDPPPTASRLGKNLKARAQQSRTETSYPADQPRS